MRIGLFAVSALFASVGLGQDEAPKEGSEYKLKIAKADKKPELEGYYLKTGKVESKDNSNLYLLADKEAEQTFLLNGEDSNLIYKDSDQGTLAATQDWKRSVVFHEPSFFSTSGYSAMGDVLILNGDPSPWTLCLKDGDEEYDKPLISFPNVFGAPGDGCILIYIQCEPVSK